MKKFNTFMITTLACTQLLASSIEVDYRFQQVDGKRIAEKAVKEIETLDENDVSDKGILKSLLVLKLAKTFQMSLEKFEKTCKGRAPGPTPRCPRPVPTPRPVQPTRPANPAASPATTPVATTPRCIPNPTPTVDETKCKEERQQVALELTADLKEVNKEILALDTKMDVMTEFIALGHKLAENMKKAQPRRYYPRPMGGPAYRPSRAMGAPSAPMPTARAASPGSLNVTTGGAQSVDAFKMAIENEQVPSKDFLTMEGFLNHFDLPLLNTIKCEQVLCVFPEYLVDAEKKKLFVQLGMDTNVTAATFKRKKLNLSIVLDISGSMGAMDGTELDRIEWAKKSLTKTVQEMNKDDLLSIVLFNGTSKVLLDATPVAKKGDILKKIATIQAGGSTNVHAGLKDGFNIVSKNFVAGAENRVILISDAGLNTGVTAESELLKLVSDFASEEIGLTAIGLGLNFNQKFIHAITMSKGGNYLFVNSGKGLKKYVDQFDYLVSPMAYNFKAELKFDGVEAKLVKAYGVPAKKDALVQELMDIRTLFFTSAGGGAILLEYDLK
jgi:hypothetical protein